MRQSWETMTSVSAGHIILTPTQPVGRNEGTKSTIHRLQIFEKKIFQPLKSHIVECNYNTLCKFHTPDDIKTVRLLAYTIMVYRVKYAPIFVSVSFLQPVLCSKLLNIRNSRDNVVQFQRLDFHEISTGEQLFLEDRLEILLPRVPL